MASKRSGDAFISFAAALLLLLGVNASAADSPLVASAKDVKWGPAPPFLAKGAHMAFRAGDPAGTRPVSVRLKLPAGYKIPAHWHPTDRRSPCSPAASRPA